MKTVLITGASQGIGLGCVEYYLEHGWSVIALDKNEISINHKSLTSLKIDFSQPNLSALLSEKLQGFNIDALINNAAIQVEKQMLETSEAEWDLVFNVNVKAVFLIIKTLAQKMSNDSSIVNISSVHARATSLGLAAYVSSKGALSALSRALALELAPKNIRVNCILPGAIDTPMLNKGLGRNSNPDVAKEKLTQATPLKKIGQPKEIAQLAFFLTDTLLASNITGQEFVSDGGVLARLASE